MTDTLVEKDMPVDHQVDKTMAVDREVDPAVEKIIGATDAAHPSEGDVAIQNYTIKYETSLPPLKNPPAEVAKTLSSPIYQAFVTKVMPTAVAVPFGPNFAAASTAVMAGVQQAVTSTAPIADIQKSIQANLTKD